jgi:hypothetical protein
MATELSSMKKKHQLKYKHIHNPSNNKTLPQNQTMENWRKKLQ